MWHRRKADKMKQAMRQEGCERLQEQGEIPDEIDTTLILPKEERTGTRNIWKGEPKKYMLHLTDIKNPGRTYKMPVEGAVTIGRKASEADIAIDYEKSVSARHCRISERSGRFYVEDLNSANGSLINGIPLTEEMELYSESTLTLGRLELKVQIR